MPKYFYLCESCGKRFASYHGMDETTDPCPACGTEDLLKKIPPMFSIKKTETVGTKTGQLVKSSIKEFKEDLQEQKDKLKSEVHEKNE